jgi:hypothetical protein
MRHTHRTPAAGFIERSEDDAMAALGGLGAVSAVRTPWLHVHGMLMY